MGFLELGGLSSFNKAVFSFWFRVPAATLAVGYASAAAALVDPNNMLQFPGIVPLVTWGPMGANSFAINTNPSMIGILCTPGSVVIDPDNYADPPFGSGTPGIASLYAGLTTNQTVDFDTGTFSDYFQIGGWANPLFNISGNLIRPAGLVVAADQWHHALVAFDLSGGSSTFIQDGPIWQVIQASQFYWALDDVNYNGTQVGPNTASCVNPINIPATSGFTGLNDIFSTSGNTPGNSGFAHDNAITNPMLPCDPLGIPNHSSFVSFNYKVEMAELQIYTGVTLDTSDQTNRRAFIKADGSPETDYTIPDNLLGKTPEVRLHLSTSWKVGLNSGTGGNFTKNTDGTINTYAIAPDITP